MSFCNITGECMILLLIFQSEFNLLEKLIPEFSSWWLLHFGMELLISIYPNVL